jgi:EmrB/QacA subfamily drug resistance transporter
MDDSAALPATAAPKGAAPDAAAPDAAALARRTRLTALIVACALFMQNLDSTVISTALPTMAHAFGEDPVRMNVALTSYLLSLAVFIPTSGWIADRFGAKRVFRAAIVVFTIGSVLCGLSPSLLALVGARVLQGFGGAMMVPVGRLVLLRTVPKSELVAAMAWLSTPALLGPVLGPPLGGFIVTYFSWPLIFFINIPIGILGVTLVTLFVEDVAEPVHARFDWTGLAFSAVALTSLLFGMETAGRGVVPQTVTIAVIGLGLLTGFGYWLHARRHAAPLIDFRLLRIRTFMVSVVAGTLFRVGIGAIPFLLPMMLQLTFDKSAVQSGLITFASSLGALFMKPVSTSALRRFGFRDTLVLNGVVSTCLFAIMAAFRPSWPVLLITGVLLIGGFFRSLQFTAFNALAYADISRAQMSAATAFYATMQQVSLTIGVSLGAASLAVAMAFGGRHTPDLGDFTFAFLIVAATTVMSIPASLMMPRGAGTETSGYRGRK